MSDRTMAYQAIAVIPVYKVVRVEKLPSLSMLRTGSDAPGYIFYKTLGFHTDKSKAEARLAIEKQRLRACM